MVHEATGLGANRVKRLEVTAPAILPVQLPVAFRVYVAFRFMKRPEEAGTGTGVEMLLTFRVVTLARGDARDVMLETPEEFRVVHEMYGIVRVSKLKTVLVALDVKPAATRLVVNRVFVTLAL